MSLMILGCQLRVPRFDGLTRATGIAVGFWVLFDVLPALALGHVTGGMIGSCLLSVFMGSLACECGIHPKRGFNHLLLLMSVLTATQLVYWTVLLLAR